MVFDAFFVDAFSLQAHADVKSASILFVDSTVVGPQVLVVTVEGLIKFSWNFPKYFWSQLQWVLFGELRKVDFKFVDHFMIPFDLKLFLYHKTMILRS